MKLLEFQQQIFSQIDSNSADQAFFKTCNVEKRLAIYHRGMKSRIKQAIEADFEDSLSLLNNFNELFSEFYKSINSFHFSLSEYYRLWNDFVTHHHSIQEPIKALTHLESLQQKSYFKAYSLFGPTQSFYIEGHKVDLNPSLVTAHFDWSLNDIKNIQNKTCFYVIITSQHSVITESISKHEYLVLTALTKNKSLEQSLSLINEFYKKDELLHWVQTTLKSWAENQWLILS